ncbi:MAG TPA: hypothetical protein VGH54_28110 [Mycobacterium sp.]|jgi:hypothetical protein|uniref:hypothetical protein n=1 Tax=Mycobacterium sp. TaxID=1785 RepID=UPI002F40F284
MITPNGKNHPMDSDARNALVNDLTHAAERFRVAADLIIADGYAHDTLQDASHTVCSAVGAVAENKHDEDALLCRLAGTLLLTGEQVSTRPMSGDVANIVSSWEGTLTPPAQDDAVQLLVTTAAFLEEHAETLTVTARPIRF